MQAWDGAAQVASPPPGAAGWLRALLRGVPMVAVVTAGLFLLLLVRLVERPLCGMSRPVTPWITQGVCIVALRLMGIRREVRGRAMTERGAAVANHASWLDIFALNASKRIYFVSKSEVAAWPGIGWLARATGTVFIARDRREASAQTALFEARLRTGHRLMFFPEGTSTDGRRVLAFKPTLFEAFFTAGIPDLHVQPVTLAYHPPDGAAPAFYGWYGDASFEGHMVRMLAAPRHGRIVVTYHPPLRVADFAGRKDLARAAEQVVRTDLASQGLLASP